MNEITTYRWACRYKMPDGQMWGSNFESYLHPIPDETLLAVDQKNAERQSGVPLELVWAAKAGGYYIEGEGIFISITEEVIKGENK